MLMSQNRRVPTTYTSSFNYALTSNIDVLHNVARLYKSAGEHIFIRVVYDLG